MVCGGADRQELERVAAEQKKAESTAAKAVAVKQKEIYESMQAVRATVWFLIGTFA
jgi:hypothetical protein